MFALRFHSHSSLRNQAHVGVFVILMLSVLSPDSALAVTPANTHFQTNWQRTDKPVADGEVHRTWMWGPEAFTGPLVEAYEESPDGKRLVQYFDKSRMEITDPAGDPDEIWYVTNGRLVAEMLGASIQIGDAWHSGTTPNRPPEINVAGDLDDPSAPTYQTFRTLRRTAVSPGYEPRPEGHLITEVVDRVGDISIDESLARYNVTTTVLVDAPGVYHRVASPFWAFMNSSDVIWQDDGLSSGQLFPNPYYATGFPLTDAYWTLVEVGGKRQAVLVQCFERRCLTYTPGNETGWQVESGNVGRHYYQWRYGAEPVTSYDEPHAVAVSGNDVYIGSGRNNQILHFGIDGSYLGQWGGGPSGQFNFPTGLAIHDEDTLYIVEHLHNRITVYSTDGEYRFAWGQYGDEPGEFSNPYGMAISPDDVIYISDHHNHRIQMFDSRGNVLGSFGSKGSGDGQFLFPAGLAFDHAGNLLVVDSGNHRIQRFGPNGAFLGQWGEEGSGPGEFGDLRGIAVAPNGRIIVPEGINDRIQLFDADGTPLAIWTLPVGESYAGVAVAEDGSVFVTDLRNGVYKLASDGTYLSTLSIPGVP